MKHLLLTTIAAVLLVGCTDLLGPSKEKLFKAAKKGNLENAKRQLGSGIHVNRKDKENRTALDYAIDGGHKEMVRLLIAYGAKVNVRQDLITYSYKEWTPLHYATNEGHKEITELLISEGAYLNAKDSKGETPLDYAEKKRKTEIADLLRKHGGKTGEELKAEGK